MTVLTRRKLLNFASLGAGLAALPLGSVSALASASKHKQHLHLKHHACAAPSGLHHRVMAAPHPVPAMPSSDERHISFFNMHTNEQIQITYFKGGHYQQAALNRLATFMRDYRTGDVHPIDANLFDLLNRLHSTLRTSEPFTLISGYRSPQTNAMLASAGDGVARHSLHMQGMAADIQLSSRSLVSLRNAALSLGEGGVGFYPRSDFVHVDTGRVRQWRYG